jgi:hypothetical protein
MTLRTPGRGLGAQEAFGGVDMKEAELGGRHDIISDHDGFFPKRHDYV